MGIALGAAQPVRGASGARREALRHVHDEVAILLSTSPGNVLVSLVEIRVPRGVREPFVPLPPAFQPLSHEVGRQLALDPSHGRAG